MSDDGGPQFFPAKGSIIGGYSADKRGRFTEALQDMLLAVSGIAMQFTVETVVSLDDDGIQIDGSENNRVEPLGERSG